MFLSLKIKIPKTARTKNIAIELECSCSADPFSGRTPASAVGLGDGDDNAGETLKKHNQTLAKPCNAPKRIINAIVHFRNLR